MSPVGRLDVREWLNAVGVISNIDPASAGLASARRISAWLLPLGKVTEGSLVL